ncbi:MAG: hypothetical protein KBC73_11415 [Burkholderiaceae bacterium]|nr:hypothetical protein [Burkholderiaceae bacterium]
MNWQPLYQLALPRWSDFGTDLALGALLAVLALGLALWARRRGRVSMPARMLALMAAVVIGLGWGANTWDQQRLARRLAAGEVQWVQGLVQHHACWQDWVADAKGHGGRRRDWERISVAGIDFIWQPGEARPGYSRRDGEPLLHDGLWLRIAYVEDAAGEARQRRILRLERAELPPEQAQALAAAVAASSAGPTADQSSACRLTPTRRSST